MKRDVFYELVTALTAGRQNGFSTRCFKTEPASVPLACQASIEKRIGTMKDKLALTADFDAQLSDEILDTFEGSQPLIPSCATTVPPT
ncbi:hypothetical protein [Pseudomonas sp. CLCA07]